MKKQALIIFFLLFFFWENLFGTSTILGTFFSDATSPSTITNRPDGTFLINGAPFFPIGFWPFGQDVHLSQADYHELKENGFNLVASDGAPYRVNQAKNAGLKVIFFTTGGNPQYEQVLTRGSNDEIENLAKEVTSLTKNYSSTLFAYYGIDEPLGGWYGSVNIPEHLYGEPVARFFRYFQKIAELDPDHPIWTNHSGCAEGSCLWTLDAYKKELIRWNQMTKSTVTGIDYYDKTPWGLGFWTRFFKEVKDGYPGPDKGGVLTIINGMEHFYVGEGSDQTFTYEERLQTAFQTIVNGANGIIFLVCADSYTAGQSGLVKKGGTLANKQQLINKLNK